MSVLVVGSTNMDLVARAARIPAPGETILGTDFATHPGGKGANQAVAIARLGGEPHFLNRTGSDAFGEQLRQGLAAYGVRADFSTVDPTLPSGVALITVADGGQNSIVVAPGANAGILPGHVEFVLKQFTPRVILTQLEIPLETVQALADSKPEGTLLILNPAPAMELPDSILRHVDVLTPNESEAELLTGIAPIDDKSCQECAEALRRRGVQAVVITLGARGCWIQNAHTAGRIAAPKVDVVDTTAAGDAFNGALADALAYPGQMALEDAARAALLVASLSTTRRGAQESMPTIDDVRRFAEGPPHK